MRRLLPALAAVMIVGACSPQTETGFISDEKNPWLKKAETEVQRRNYQGAAEFYEKALQLNPTSQPMHWAVAMLYEQHLNDQASAIYHYQRFIQLKPEPARVKMAGEFINRAKYSLAANLRNTPIEGATEFNQLQDQNKSLKEQNEKLRERLAEVEMKLASFNQPPPIPPTEPTPNVAAVTPPRPAQPTQPDRLPIAPPPPPQPVAPGATGVDAAGATKAAKKPAGPTRTQRYVVKRGDTLAGIADRFYGDRNAWMTIYRANKSAIPNKDKLLADTVLTIPARHSR
jgi:tetratricopeptide (TPR) repeat protein